MIDFNLANKNFIITGSTKGIGAGIAKVFLAAGAQVCINARSDESIEAFKQEYPSVLSFSGDLTEESKRKELFQYVTKHWSQVDGLVCNIGSGTSVPPGMEDEKEWLRVLELNLLSATTLVNESVPYLEKSKGTIVCISSICGHEALGAPLTYSSAKAALNSFVIGASRYLAAKGIRINAVSPGNILFPGSSWEKKLDQDHDKIMNIINDTVPMKRFGTPEEIGHCALFLSSSLSSFCTGSILVADGGQTRTSF